MNKFILKGLFVAFLFSITLISCSTEENDVNTARATTLKDGDPPSGSVKVTFGFGRTSRNCDGIGICRYEKTTVTIEGISIQIDKQVKQVRTVITPKLQKSGRDLVFRAEFVDQESYEWAKEFFSGDAVIMEEDTNFDMKDMYSWGIPVVENFTVPAGAYPITLDNETGRYGFTFVSSTM